MLSAAVVGVLEEVWFRGGLFTLLHRCSGVTAALFGGSVIYAGAHFLAVPGGVHSGEAQALTAFEVLEAAAQNVFQMQHLDSFVALFIAGVTLGLVRLRQGDVVMCMGIHAGWVLTIKVFKKLTYLSPAQTNRFLAGHYDDVVGWTASVCLLVMLIFVWRYMRPSSSSMASSAPRPRSQPELSPQMQQHPPRE
jgi:membrane protease YdiL (CAAX protease family)